jgi:hypothetical protein
MAPAEGASKQFAQTKRFRRELATSKRMKRLRDELTFLKERAVLSLSDEAV